MIVVVAPYFFKAHQFGIMFVRNKAKFVDMILRFNDQVYGYQRLSTITLLHFK